MDKNLSKIKFKKLAILTAECASGKKSKNIKVIDLGGKSSLCDFVVIVSVESSPQLEAVEEEITKKLKSKDIYSRHTDGRQSKTWRIYDYGGFFVHLIAKDEREFYGLDKIYHFGKLVVWEEKTVRKKPAKSRKIKRSAVSKPKIRKIAKKYSAKTKTK